MDKWNTDAVLHFTRKWIQIFFPFNISATHHIFFVWASCYSLPDSPSCCMDCCFLNSLREMNISYDFRAPPEVGDLKKKNQWFQTLDFHRKLTIGRCYWWFSYVHSLKANLRKIKNVPTDLPLGPYQVIPRWLYWLSVVYDNTNTFKVDFHCTIKVCVTL